MDDTKIKTNYNSQPIDFSTSQEKKQLLYSTPQTIRPWLRLWYRCLPLSKGRCALLAAVGALGVFVLLRMTLLDTLFLNRQHAHESQRAKLDQWSEQLAVSIRHELDEPRPGLYTLSSDKPTDRSQNGQSCAVAAIFLNNGLSRTFLEAGAYNGEDLSNTLFLERELGWTGVLVEPDPWNYWSLRKRNRRARSLNACLAPDTVASDQIFKQSDTMGRLAASAEVASKRGLFTRVRCYPLFAVLRAANLTTLDYLALDLEGLEMKVLQTIPWDSVQITFLQIEASHLDTLEINSPPTRNLTHLGVNSRKPNNEILSPISATSTVNSKRKDHEVSIKTRRSPKPAKTHTKQSSSESLPAGKPLSTRTSDVLLNGCSPAASILPRAEVLTDSQRELTDFLKSKGYDLLGVLGEDFMFARLDLLGRE